MLSDLKACYSPQDLIFTITLFILVLFTVGAFIVLMSHALRGVLGEVQYLKERKQKDINTP